MKNFKYCSENILGLDVGTKRVGVALIYKGSSIPEEVGTFERGGKGAEKKIMDIIVAKEIHKLVVGLPLLRDNSESPQSNRVRQFIKRIVARTNIEIVFQDEYLTSEEAKERLINRGLSPSDFEKKGRIDSMAACIILEQYIEAHNK